MDLMSDICRQINNTGELFGKNSSQIILTQDICQQIINETKSPETFHTADKFCGIPVVIVEKEKIKEEAMKYRIRGYDVMYPLDNKWVIAKGFKEIEFVDLTNRR